MSTLSKFIQVQRKRRGMTQEYLASEIGVSRPTYIKIERGKRDPTISELRRIASAFGMPLENLLSTSDNFLMINEQERSVPVKRASERKGAVCISVSLRRILRSFSRCCSMC